MHKEILIATDGSELAKNAVLYGLSMAKALKSKVSFVTITESWIVREAVERLEAGAENPIKDYENTMAAWAASVLSDAAHHAKEMGVDCETIHVKDRHPAEGIIETTKSRECDLIVMASHGRRGLNRVLLGSVANEVVSKSPVPVLIYR